MTAPETARVDRRPARVERAAPPDGDWVARCGPSPEGGGEEGSRPLWLRPRRGAAEAEVAATARCSVVFAGRLAERSDLAAALGAPPPADDVALVAAAWERWGDRLLEHLRGRFAVVVWDRIERRLWSARDPLGQHPLFLSRTAGGVLLSPSIPALLDAPAVSREVNRAALADHLRRRWPRPEETYRSAVERVPAGWAFIADARGTRLTRVWHPAAGAGAAPDAGAAREAYAAALERAVARCLDRGPAAIFLSGGVDSASVALFAAEAARRSGGPPPGAFGLIFPEASGCDESAAQRRLAARLGMPLLSLDLAAAVGCEGSLAAGLRAVAGRPAPLVNLWVLAYQQLARAAAADGRRVVLTGGGGDEWLGVTPLLAADLLRRGDLAGWMRLGAALRRALPLAARRVWWGVAWTFGVRPLAVAALRRIAPRATAAWRRRRRRRSLPRWLAPDRELRRTVERRAEEHLDEPAPASHYRAEMDRGLDHALVAMEFEEWFDCGRRVGVEIAQPFWDPELVALLYRLPPAVLAAGGRDKGLARGLLAARLGDAEIAGRRKVLATAFVHRLLLAEGAAAWRRLGGFRELGRLGVVDAGAAGRLIESLLAAGDGRRAFRLWDLLNLESWLRGGV